MDIEEEFGLFNLFLVVIVEWEVFLVDYFVILDGLLYIFNLFIFVFGVCGIVIVCIMVYGFWVLLYSGYYGNYVFNLVLCMVQFLVLMKNDVGVVIILYWYDGIILSELVKNILVVVLDKLEEINYKLGFVVLDQVGGSLQEVIQYFSLNVWGLFLGWVGVVVCIIILVNVVVNLDICLVKESDFEWLMELL